MYLDKRIRLSCEILGKTQIKNYSGNENAKPENVIIKDFHVINEVVIDRGASANAL